ncbi:MMPL family transporter [Sporolactobacillus laevolacticus]|uniref:Membrane protein n=1 Tax=Sporolactobacillus laevolacticus DSM 442 TaxID=1395513 RepID=V6J8Y8_9BACL|nr:MMPL family transporter [Sporolactobacillus laevolacticus]EST13249.1 membrane protein [Sporolactobacillus laevolacticus DSM 442]
MRKIISLRWVLLGLWIIGLAALIFTSPNMNELVRDKGGYALPKDYSTSVAGKIEKKFSGKQDTTTYVAVFHANQGLTEQNMNDIEKTLQQVKDHKKSLKIESIIDSFDHKDLKDQFVSKNKKTLIAAFQVKNISVASVHALRTKMDAEIKTSGVKTYLTGQQLINDDMSTSAESGLHKTEGITVVFILVVLFLVFRSFVAPFVPLFTVGLSYMVAQVVVAFLVKYMNFPVSNFTQIFMVAIMFGIGTDYCILLLSRFKEELAKGKDKYQAALTTFKTAGTTVLHSGIPVFIAFLSLAFVQFNLYRSAMAVGVGVIFLLLALFTLLPLFMVTLGKQLFWPMNGTIREPKSNLWAGAGKLAFTRPIIALLIVALFTIPPIITYSGQLSFNSPEELPDQYAAKAGFDVVSKDFGAGNISPATIYLQNDDNMRTTDYVALIERLSIAIKKDPNVDKVMSVSRPLGNRLDDIYVTKQSDTIHKGLSDATDGLGTLQNSLQNTSKKINASQLQLNSALTGIDNLQTGTNDTKNGVQKMQDVLTQISDGIKSGSAGTAEIRKNVQSAETQLTQLQSGQEQIQNGYQQVAKNLQAISDQLSQFSTGSGAQPAIDTTALEKTLGQIQTSMQAYLAAHPEAMQDPNFRQLAAGLQQLPADMKNMQTAIQSAITKQTQSAQTQITQLNKGIQSLADAMNQLNSQSTKVTNGMSAFKSGLSQLDTGLGQLEDGLNKASSGQDQVVQNTPQITNALDQIASGQNQLKSGFGDVQSQMKSLSGGLAKGADGAKKIKNGVNSANDFIGNWTEVSYAQSGIYVPDQIFNNKSFKSALDQYMSKDGKITSISVTMKDDPYTNEGIAHFRALKKELPSLLKGTKLENAHVGINGIASFNSDLKQLSGSDYQKAVTFVIIGVFIALVIVLRSLSMPTYLMASLLLTYFSSMGFAELIFTKLLHYSGLTWTTQFFGFIVLVALGIDYSIFVMTRFNEYARLAIKERLLLTLWHMGSVIFSAVLILSGTFAAMMPSGMLSLVEISAVVIIGLVLYAAVIIPLFVPVMVKLFGRGNWWPFIPKKPNELKLDQNESL